MQASADVTHADNPHGAVFQLKPVALGQHQQRGENVFHDGNRVTARRGGETDSGLLQPFIIHMIGPCRCGPNELNRLTGEQRLIYFGHRAHHQGVGVVQFVDRDRATRNSLNVTQAAKQLTGVRHIFINEDFHV